ncbi:MAG: serine/threonine-protein kinase PknK [Sandaracinaceae bacterium]
MSERTQLDTRAERAVAYVPSASMRLTDEVRLVRELGAGGMSSVWLAEHARLGHSVAVKLVHSADGPLRDRLMREAQLTAKIDHPHAMRVLEQGQTSEGIPFLVLELIEGESLADRLERGPLSLSDARRLVAQVAGVLEVAHGAGVLHRDLKPANLMLLADRSELFVKVVDFGIARAIDGSETRGLTMPGTMVGTALYMSPEQLVDGRPADAVTDLWGLGVVAYEALTAQRPFRGHGRAAICAAQLLKRFERPSRLVAELPASLDAFFDRVFATEPEARFQSAVELAEAFEAAATGQTTGGPPAAPRPAPLRIPDRLFGREREIGVVLDAFERASTGRSRVLFITGFSGTGKTSLVATTEETLVASGATVVSGKFDQFDRATPYDSLIRALRELIRKKLHAGGTLDASALAGQRGSALIAVIPELEQLIGPRPPLEEVSPADARNRFQVAVERLVSTLATKEHPLVLFFDDLQWADLASIDLVTNLATDPESRHVLFIGAYRDNEINDAHPLVAAFERLEASRAAMDRLALGPLSEDAVQDLISATFPGATGRARLASVCYAKTHGNAFFLRRLLENLCEEGPVRFDHASRAWTWDLTAIESRAVTEDVVEFVASEIRRMPEASGRAVAVAACIGDSFDLEPLAVALGAGARAALDQLRLALASELIVPATEEVKLAADMGPERTTFRFSHDRIRQAARSLIDETSAARAHAVVGRHLLRTLDDAERERRLFEVVDHLNAGIGSDARGDERVRLRALNLAAARRARSSAAFEAAHGYMKRALALLSGDPWAEDHAQTMALHVEGARAAYLGGDYETMASLIELAVAHATTPLERVLAREVELHALVAQQRLIDVVALAAELVAELGFELPLSPAAEDVQRAVVETMARLDGVTADDLAKLPVALDPNVVAALRIQNDTMSSAYLAAPNLLPIMACNIVRLTLESGVCKESPYGFAVLGLVLSAANQIDVAYEVGKLATELLDRIDDRTVHPRTLHVVTSFVRPFVEPMRVSIEEARRVFRIGADVGDFEYAAWALHTMVRDGLFSGIPLDELEPMAQRSMAVLEHHRQVAAIGVQAPFAQMVENLRGRAADPTRLVGPRYDEEAQRRVFVDIQYRGAVFVLGVVGAYVRYLFRALPEALDTLDACADYADGAVATYNQVYFHQLRALTLLGLARPGTPGADEALLAIAPNLERLRTWQRFSPASHDHRVALVEAEVARVRGDADAARLYDQAIALAAKHEYLAEVALANELAYRYHDALGHEVLAAAYFVAATEAYERWGAHAKVAHLKTTGGRAH